MGCAGGKVPQGNSSIAFAIILKAPFSVTKGYVAFMIKIPKRLRGNVERQRKICVSEVRGKAF